MKSETTKKLEQAYEIYRRRGAHSDADLDKAAEALMGQGLWSLSNIALILGTNMRQVTQRVSKSDSTGGRLNPATLELIVEESRLADLGESNPLLTAKIAEMGTSWTFLAKLLGQTQGQVRYRLKKAAQMRAEGAGRDG